MRLLEKYHLMPKQWDRNYPYDFLIPKYLRDLDDKDMLEGAAEAKAAKQLDDAKRAAQTASKGAKH